MSEIRHHHSTIIVYLIACVGRVCTAPLLPQAMASTAIDGLHPLWAIWPALGHADRQKYTTKTTIKKQFECNSPIKADEGPEGPAWSDERIGEAFELSKGGVAGIRRRFCRRGLERTVKRKNPDREYERKLDGEKEAELIRLACSEAPEGRSEWSLRLLSDKMVELGVVDTLSHETVRWTLKKADSSLI